MTNEFEGPDRKFLADTLFIGKRLLINLDEAEENPCLITCIKMISYNIFVSKGKLRTKIEPTKSIKQASNEPKHL